MWSKFLLSCLYFLLSVNSVHFETRNEFSCFIVRTSKSISSTWYNFTFSGGSFSCYKCEENFFCVSYFSHFFLIFFLHSWIFYCVNIGKWLSEHFLISICVQWSTSSRSVISLSCLLSWWLLFTKHSRFPYYTS